MANKKRIALAIAEVCALMLSLGVTSISGISYLQDRDTAVNHLSVDSNESAMQENFHKPGNLNEGMIISKQVAVTNTGDVPCYVRVRVMPASDPDAYQFDFNTQDWTRDGDGEDCFWYYNNVLQPGETTSNLMTTATLTRDLNGLSEEDAQILVYEETTQAYGYNDAMSAFQ